MTLKSPVVIFESLETSAASLTSPASATSPVSTASTALFPQKMSSSWCLDHPWHQIDQYESLLVWGIIKNSIFNWNLRSFLSEALEASLCYLFEIWLMKHKSPNLLKPLGTTIHKNSQFYYPPEPFSFHHFNVRHPVSHQT